jgi:hypothetical protein
MKYKLNPDFSYYIDLYDIIIINKKTQTQLVIKYPDAAVLALMLKNYPYPKIIRMISKIALVTPKHAEGLTKDSLTFFTNNNILEI